MLSGFEYYNQRRVERMLLGLILTGSLVFCIFVGMRLVETRYRWLLGSQPAPTAFKRIVKVSLRVVGWTLLIIFLGIMVLFSGFKGIAVVVVWLALRGLIGKQLAHGSSTSITRSSEWPTVALSTPASPARPRRPLHTTFPSAE